MPDNEDPLHGDVGYRKPPTHTRFRKGVSGNPRGRPKGRRNLATALGRTLQEKVIINENGVRKSVTKLEAAVKQLVNKAAGGDLIAMRQLTAIVDSAESETTAAQDKADLAEVDRKIMNRLLERLQKSEKGKNSANND
jgi:hypothetical protein